MAALNGWPFSEVNTIRRGRREIDDDLAGRPTDRVRQAGRWAASAGKKSPAIEDRIKEIVNDDIAGSATD